MWVYKICVFLSIFLVIHISSCKAISNSNFNASLRDFSGTEDNNTTNVRTLQKEHVVRYANFAPVRYPIKFKEIPDNALSSTSSHGRGLHHEHHGYGLLDYEDHYGHGYDFHHDSPHGLHDYHHDDHSGHHDYDHHYSGHHGDHHDHHGYHHKHVAHALAAKTILWPIAGIALLGAAAALVTNPVLLQLGVVSGRRKRRETEKGDDEREHTLIDWVNNNYVKYLTKTRVINENEGNDKIVVNLEKIEDISKKDALIDRIMAVNKKVLPRKGIRNADSAVLRNESEEEKKFVPILLKTKTNNG